MRSPRAFIARSSWVVTGFVSSAIGSRARRGSGLERPQLALPEWAVRKLGVRDHERRLAHHPMAEADDVQVQGARSPAHARPALATALRFDRVQVREQLGGLEGGLEQDHLIEVGPLRYRPEGCGLLDAGLLEQAGGRRGPRPPPRRPEMGGAVPPRPAPRPPN